jgi:hypothetical protein
LIKRILHVCVQILVIFQAQREITSVSMVYRGAHGYQLVSGGSQNKVDNHLGLRSSIKPELQWLSLYMNLSPFENKGSLHIWELHWVSATPNPNTQGLRRLGLKPRG